MTTHTDRHPLANQTVKVHFNGGHPQVAGSDHPDFKMDFLIEDWWDHLTSASWTESDGKPAVIVYAIRLTKLSDLPIDDDVVYGHSVSSGLGHLVHSSEIVDLTAEQMHQTISAIPIKNNIAETQRLADILSPAEQNDLNGSQL